MFLVLWGLASYLFYRRFPTNYQYPNFFGEEGWVFSRNIYDHGLLQAMGTTFNGYYIWGLYLLTKLGFVVNSLLFGGEFVNLPRAFAVVSYGFLGFVSVLPLALLRKYIKLPVLLLVIPLTIYMPMRGWDYGIIGALGNMKFAIVYIAFLLLVYRHYLPAKSRKFYIVDVLLLICAYTNITVYAMLPFGLIRYWPTLRGGHKLRKLKSLLLTERSLQSLIVLGLALLPQLYIVKRDGIPPMPGYLDQPYTKSSTVEIFMARSYLYSLIFTFYKYMTDTWTIILTLLVTALGTWWSGKYRSLFWFGMVTIFGITLLFTLKRPGVSMFYTHYKDAGPDQFFFTQNWIFSFIFLLFVVEVVDKLRWGAIKIGIYASLALGFLVFMAPQTGSWGKNDFEHKLVGDIYQVAAKACAKPKAYYNLTIYPTPDVVYHDIPRHRLCTRRVSGNVQ